MYSVIEELSAVQQCSQQSLLKIYDECHLILPEQMHHGDHLHVVRVTDNCCLVNYQHLRG